MLNKTAWYKGYQGSFKNNLAIPGSSWPYSKLFL